jgi:hypothetical protein
MRDEAPAATRGGVNEVGCDRLENRLGLVGRAWIERSDQLRCCGNPSLDVGQQASTTTGRTATYKLRATPSHKKYCFISISSEPSLEIMKLVSLLLVKQIAQKLGDTNKCPIFLH